MKWVPLVALLCAAPAPALAHDWRHRERVVVARPDGIRVVPVREPRRHHRLHHAVWVPGRWVRLGHHRVYRRGYWTRGW
jgi:hypothetical protein